MATIEVIIDGMNISRSREKAVSWIKKDDAAACIEVVQYFRQFADVVKIFGALNWCESSKGLQDLRNQGILFAAPGGIDDDFMLSYIDRKGGFVVTNDLFRDQFSRYDKEWIGYHSIGYMWEPEFAVDPNAMLRMEEYRIGSSSPQFALGMGRLQSSQRMEEVEDNETPDPLFGIGHHVPPHLHPSTLPQSLQLVPPPPPSVANYSNQLISPLPPPPPPVALVSKSLSMSAHPAEDIVPLQDEHDVFFSVPNGAVGRIIGTGGKNIHAIRDEFKCKVLVEELDEEHSQITIQGNNAESVDGAKTAVLQKVKTYERYKGDDRATQSSSISYSSSSSSSHGTSRPSPYGGTIRGPSVSTTSVAPNTSSPEPEARAIEPTQQRPQSHNQESLEQSLCLQFPSLTIDLIHSFYAEAQGDLSVLTQICVQYSNFETNFLDLLGHLITNFSYVILHDFDFEVIQHITSEVSTSHPHEISASLSSFDFVSLIQNEIRCGVSTCYAIKHLGYVAPISLLDILKFSSGDPHMALIMLLPPKTVIEFLFQWNQYCCSECHKANDQHNPLFIRKLTKDQHQFIQQIQEWTRNVN